jgi:hypothetical protein
MPERYYMGLVSPGSTPIRPGQEYRRSDQATASVHVSNTISSQR